MSQEQNERKKWKIATRKLILLGNLSHKTWKVFAMWETVPRKALCCTPYILPVMHISLKNQYD